MTSAQGKAAWVLLYEQPRPPFQDDQFFGVKPGEPIAVLPWNTSKEKLEAVIDALVQIAYGFPEDKLDYVRRTAPYPATTQDHWEVEGGWNPYIRAVRVDHLAVIPATETESSRFDFVIKKKVRALHPRWNVVV